MRRGSRSLGQIAAGCPLLAEENVEDEIAVPEPLGRGADFLLRVKGDSMIDAGILDGDTLVVQRSRTRGTGRSSSRSSGDDESAERGHREDLLPRERPRPPPAREQRRSSRSTPTTSQVLGKVIGVFRSLR